MTKLMAWVFGQTKVGRGVDKARLFVAGKKTYVAGLATSIPALLMIVSKFGDQGSAYLLSLPSTEEFAALMLGIGMMTGRAAITKAAAGK